MAPTRKTGTSAKPTATESVEELFDQSEERSSRDASAPVSGPKRDSAQTAESASSAEPATTQAGPPAQEPASTQEPAFAQEPEGTAAQAASSAATPQPTSSAATPKPAEPVAPAPLPPLSATQLLNDPLLGTHDAIIFDLGLKLRWAAIMYAALGVVASWLLAAVVAIATRDAIAFAWAIAATVLVAVGAVWYFADVSTRFSTVDAYRRAKTPQAVARLDRGSVVGLYSVIGAWIGIGLAALAVVAGVVTAVLTLAVGAAGWAWFFGAAPTVLLYLYGFLALHYRLLERTRDAVA
ncbi:hypothetical protein [Humibacter albus]|uniref:hypothetical protein n=1 Tax=Humibacter albus TaxID=427754 RepID=UPI0003B39880|nr:hypothetical protein [Humibacter albus]